jgi:hypothetical protein
VTGGKFTIPVKPAAPLFPFRSAALADLAILPAIKVEQTSGLSFQSEENMRTQLLGRWVGFGLVTSLLTMGCSHCHRHCYCCDECVPTTSAYAVIPALPTVVLTPAPAPEAPVEHKVAKAPVPQQTIAATVVAPEDGGGSIAGTVTLTMTEAEAMGIRPGYTPGALFMPPREAPGMMANPTVSKPAPSDEEELPRYVIPASGQK